MDLPVKEFQCWAAVDRTFAAQRHIADHLVGSKVPDLGLDAAVGRDGRRPEERDQADDGDDECAERGHGDAKSCESRENGI